MKFVLAMALAGLALLAPAQGMQMRHEPTIHDIQKGSLTNHQEVQSARMAEEENDE